MRVPRQKAVLVGVVCAVLALLSVQEARAATRTASRLDNCVAVCPNGGCNASTPWYNFWDDCICGCLPNGYANCSCS